MKEQLSLMYLQRIFANLRCKLVQKKEICRFARSVSNPIESGDGHQINEYKSKIQKSWWKWKRESYFGGLVQQKCWNDNDSSNEYSSKVKLCPSTFPDKDIELL